MGKMSGDWNSEKEYRDSLVTKEDKDEQQKKESYERVTGKLLNDLGFYGHLCGGQKGKKIKGGIDGSV